MKAIRILMAAMAVMTGLTVFAQAPVFKDLPSGEGIEKVYISKALMQLAGSTMSTPVNGVNIPDPSKINNIEVVNVESRKYFKTVEEKLNAYVNANKLQVLLQNDDGDEITVIYGLMSDDGKKLKELVIYNNEGDELNVVVINGEIDPQSIMSR